MYKIYINKSCILLNNKNIDKNEFNEIICLKDINIEKMLKNLRKKEKKIFLFDKNIEKLYDSFASNFTEIESGGGLVSNENSEFLLIFRDEKWDLPKGKKESGELIETTAIREVAEECNLEVDKLQITDYLDSTFHIYWQDDKTYLKRTYWYRMKYIGSSKPEPQMEEGITKVEWLNQSKLDKVYKNSYPSIIDLLIKNLKEVL